MAVSGKSDFFQTSGLGSSPVANLGPVSTANIAANADTGDLRRRYNFGDRVSELSIAQDPFFRFVSKVSKKPTDDPTFKFTEKRSSYTKRYAYMIAFDASAGSSPSKNKNPGTNPIIATVYSTLECRSMISLFENPVQSETRPQSRPCS